jgi:hypothetical protein
VAGLMVTVGSLVTREGFSALAKGLIGSVVVAALLLIPLAGLVFFLLAMCMTAGATFPSRLGARAPA